MKYPIMVVMAALFLDCSIVNAQDEKKTESVSVPAAMTDEEAVKLYYELGGRLNIVLDRVPDNAPTFLAQMAILADHSTVFTDEDKKTLNETGIALFSYTYYYDEIVTLLPPQIEEQAQELITIFSDQKRLARIKTVVEAMETLSIFVVQKIDSLIDKIPPSDRLEKWMNEARARYEAAKTIPAPEAKTEEEKKN